MPNAKGTAMAKLLQEWAQPQTCTAAIPAGQMPFARGGHEPKVRFPQERVLDGRPRSNRMGTLALQPRFNAAGPPPQGSCLAEESPIPRHQGRHAAGCLTMWFERPVLLPLLSRRPW